MGKIYLINITFFSNNRKFISYKTGNAVYAACMALASDVIILVTYVEAPNITKTCIM